jgi:hypothetical protein
MGAAVEVLIEAELATGIWTDITADVDSASGLEIAYGIAGSGPKDLVAGTGTSRFSLKNHAGNSAAQQGYYSPLHASVRSGWALGIGIRISFYRASVAAVSVATITRSGPTATLTSSASHGLETGDWIRVAGDPEAGDTAKFNGSHKITKTGPTTLTYTVEDTAERPELPATGTLTLRRVYVKHHGHLASVSPLAGQYGPQLAAIVSYDGMRELAAATLRDVALQVSVSESVTTTAILDALPASAQPLSREIATGVDTFPYALDEIGSGEKALGVIHSVAASSFSLHTLRGDGTYRLQSRHSRAIGASAYTFADTDVADVEAPAATDALWNLIDVVIHPRSVDAAATTIVYSSSFTTPLAVPAGETVTQWVAYRDPVERTQQLIGALSVDTSLTARVDFEGNSAADGTGTDQSSDLAITVTPRAANAKIEIQNTGAATVYLVSSGNGSDSNDPGVGKPYLQLKGKGVYDLGPSSYTAESAQPYGSRSLKLDLKYQGSAETAQSYATYLLAQYGTLIAQVGRIEFVANKSDDLLLQALARDPGDIVTITEPVTGVTAKQVVIHGVRLGVSQGPLVTCSWIVAPAAPFQAWILGSAGRTELGVTTSLGF